MNLQKHFDFAPPIVEEFPKGSNVWHIPVHILKKQLSDNFVSWGTENCKTTFIHHGHNLICSTSLELHLTFKDENGDLSAHKFVGAFTLKDSQFPDSSDYEGICLSIALQNASKNIGNAFGASLNREEMYTLEPKKEELTSATKKAINNIVNLKK